MKTKQHTNQCRRIRNGRQGFWTALKTRITARLSDHIVECPRCQQRLAIVNRVELGLALIKTQPLDVGLLSRANSCTLDVLKHSLRHAPKAIPLRKAKSDTSRFEKIRPTLERTLNTAACLFIVIMIKVGVSTSLLDYKDKGQTAIENYYARNLDDQIFDEIFPTDVPS